jgi:hypothetical protein
MVPQTESSPESSLHLEIGERAPELNERQEKVDIGGLVPNSDEGGTWYYVVDCATCKAAIPFKHAPEGEPILRFPKMRVRCFQCRAVHAYGADLVSHRKAVAPRGISKSNQPDATPDKAQEASWRQLEDRSDGDPAGREIVECKIEPDTPSSLHRADGVIVAFGGKRGTIFFLSSCLFAIGLTFQLALNVFYPVPNYVFNDAHSYGTAALLNGAYFGAILCGLALFIFGAGIFIVDSCGSERDVFRKGVLELVESNALVRSLRTWIKSSAKTASVTSLVRQVRRVLSPMVSGAATFRSLVNRSANLQLRVYRKLAGKLFRPAVPGPVP